MLDPHLTHHLQKVLHAGMLLWGDVHTEEVSFFFFDGCCCGTNLFERARTFIFSHSRRNTLSLIMFGNLYVGLTDPLPLSKKLDGVNRQLYERSRKAGEINIVSYLLIGLVFGLLMYFSRYEDERNAPLQIGLPILYGVVLSLMTWIWYQFPFVVLQAA